MLFRNRCARGSSAGVGECGISRVFDGNEGYQDEKMREYLKEIPYSRCMLSIQGIGEVTVAGLIGEVGDFGKYKTIAEITKLAGLDLFEVSSGKHKGESRISQG